jgi:outer membrane lipoprotein carrier protein
MLRKLFIALWFVMPVANADPAAERSLASLLQSMGSLQGQFVQTIRDEQQVIQQQSHGEVALKKPQKLLWRTLEPFRHDIVTNGETLWIYDPDLEQVSRQTFESNVDQTPALLLSGDVSTVAQDYEITEPVLGHFQLLPKQADGVFTRIALEFNDGQLQQLSLTDNFGQHTEIVFKQLLLNAELDDQLFEFVVPAGVELVDNER